jgi:hypothetical protein
MADGPAAFARAVVDSLATPLTTTEVDKRRQFAAGHSWRARAAVLARELGLDVTDGGLDPSAPSPHPPLTKDAT